VRTLGPKEQDRLTLKGFDGRRTLSGLIQNSIGDPMVVASLQPWAEISERLGR